MWDIQERDGHCKVATGQRSNPGKDDGYDEDDDIQIRGGGKPSKMA
jgi:hypothetical protein